MAVLLSAWASLILCSLSSTRIRTALAPGTMRTSASCAMLSRHWGFSSPIRVRTRLCGRKIPCSGWFRVVSAFKISLRPSSNSSAPFERFDSSLIPTEPATAACINFLPCGITKDPTIPDCALTQPNFAAEQAKNKLSFRIPLQMFGLGLIDSIQDRELLARHDATASLRAPLGIQGRPNRSGNDNTITRFGWKAQNKSITIFAGEAYNVEMGITNELFPQSKEEDPACNGPGKPEPNDVTRTQINDTVNPQNQSLTIRNTSWPIGCSFKS